MHQGTFFLSFLRSLSQLPLPDSTNKSSPSPNNSSTLPLCKVELEVNPCTILSRHCTQCFIKRFCCSMAIRPVCSEPFYRRKSLPKSKRRPGFCNGKTVGPTFLPVSQCLISGIDIPLNYIFFGFNNFKCSLCLFCLKKSRMRTKTLIPLGK